MDYNTCHRPHLWYIKKGKVQRSTYTRALFPLLIHQRWQSMARIAIHLLNREWGRVCLLSCGPSILAGIVDIVSNVLDLSLSKIIWELCLKHYKIHSLFIVMFGRKLFSTYWPLAPASHTTIVCPACHFVGKFACKIEHVNYASSITCALDCMTHAHGLIDSRKGATKTTVRWWHQVNLVYRQNYI